MMRASLSEVRLSAGAASVVPRAGVAAALSSGGPSPVLAAPLARSGGRVALGSFRMMTVSLAEGLKAPAELTGLRRITVGVLRGSTSRISTSSTSTSGI